MTFSLRADLTALVKAATDPAAGKAVAAPEADAAAALGARAAALGSRAGALEAAASAAATGAAATGAAATGAAATRAAATGAAATGAAATRAAATGAATAANSTFTCPVLGGLCGLFADVASDFQIEVTDIVEEQELTSSNYFSSRIPLGWEGFARGKVSTQQRGHHGYLAPYTYLC